MRHLSDGWGRRVGIALLVLGAALFSFLNAGERVTLNLGVTIFYRISLVGLVFVVFLFGMLTMFLFGLRHDQRIRAAVRGRTAPPPPPDPLPLDPPPDPRM